MRKNQEYKQDLLRDLREDREYARAYLAAAWKDSQEVFLIALRDVSEALKGSIGAVANEAHVNRENLYRSLSKEGNPRLNTFYSVVNVLGFSLFDSPSSGPNLNDPQGKVSLNAEPPCDKCGTFDRVPGSKFCKECGAQ